jgi:transcriptional regulator with XRE-family HTH domain
VIRNETKERSDYMRQWLIQYRGNLTQEQVSFLAGISRSAYSNIENGKRDPSVSMAKKIAKALRFDWRIFFDDKCVEMKQNKTA